VPPEDLPVIGLADGQVLRNPTNIELANAYGARTRPGEGLYDVVIVGGGPAGLSAAVYATSEGLRTALIESTAMGGQAGTSSMIRNFLGFPRGISGSELAARAFEQAILFGTEMVYGTVATALRRDGERWLIGLADGTDVPGRSVIIATGVSYRTLEVPSLEPFHGRGVFYGAAMSEAPRLHGEEVFVVGGGNSAGQAAVHLARFARRVTVLVRSGSLAESMSRYLLQELDATSNVDIRYGSEVVGGRGPGRLESVDVRDRTTGSTTTHPAAGLFVLIGAAPPTAWLPAEVDRDRWGYITTGPTADEPHRRAFESSLRGVFAVGDVRRDSVKRVASAVGDGAVCVRSVHDHLWT
jgi:thioredoxin reductase (NADPH)